MPKISVIIPVYNVEKYLRRCLDSVLAQTFTDWEAICVNDGSPDNSAQILAEYAERDPRFKIVTKANGGLSDARNAGMAVAKGTFINFLDSDDLIHPQTFEIAYALVEQEDADIVSWYKDPLFRPRLLVRHALGFNIDNTMPRGLKRHFSLDEVKYHTTDDIFAHITEYSHTKIEYPIKHFYVWRYLIRRSLVQDVPFLKGVIFEEFPWWSEVILKNPRAVITNLPFYYYFPNIGSIDRSSSRIKKIKNWIQGLEHIYQIYEERATPYQKKHWQRECMWAVITTHIANKLEWRVTDLEDRRELAQALSRLNELGTFDNPFTIEGVKARQRILRFISKYQ